MWRIKRILHTHIMLIYFIFIYSHYHHYNSHTYTHVSATSTPTTDTYTSTTTTSSDESFLGDDISPERIKLIKEQYKEIAKELVFDLKGKPTQAVPEKAYVPRAMLEQYMQTRDSVRDIIPDDRDFYGKINIDDAFDSHEDFWSAVYNKYGSYDIRVDMGPQGSEVESNSYRFKGEASHIGNIPTSDPEDVSPNIEPILPPHSRSIQSQKQFRSVHLKFNLSQSESYQTPTASDDLRGAELYLSRERLYNCLFHECGQKKPVPFFNNNNNNNNSGRENSYEQNESESSDNIGQPVPRFQRVYILQVYGYDQFNEPRTKIHESKRIKTDETTPISFNIYSIIKTWLMNPKSNYGIIVRITNEDKDYEDAIRHVQLARRKKSTRSTENVTNSAHSGNEDENQSVATMYYQEIIPDHVRLKREFRSKSESDEDWKKYQPTILIYSQPSDVGKKHVKRHYDNADSMQADDPDTSIPFASTNGNYASTSTIPSTSASATDSSQRLTTNESSRGSLSTGPISRRDQAPNQSRRGSSNRNYSGTARSQQQSSGQRSRGKGKQSARQADRCSKRSLAIDFDEVGWSNWIIAPYAYLANYCAGDCSWPLVDTQNATNHAIIQAIYHSVGRVVPKSCCAPVKMSSMKILYQLDGIVQMKTYDDMIVDACGCL